MLLVQIIFILFQNVIFFYLFWLLWGFLIDVSYGFFTDHLYLYVQGGHFSGIYRKVQLKPLKWVKVPKPYGEGEEERPTEALMVLKYGGVLTHAGRKQVASVLYCDYYAIKIFLTPCTCSSFLGRKAEELGRYFRNNMYPG